MEDSLEILTDPSSFSALEPEWRTLFADTTSAHFSAGFDWCRLNWETTARPRGCRLLCLVMRRAGRPVLIWPFVVARKWGLWSQAVPLASMSTEYSHPLVAQSADTPEIVTRALKSIRRRCDLISLPRVRGATQLHTAVSREASFRVLSSMPTSKVSFIGFPDWPSYVASLNGGTMRELRRRRRRLREQGVVEFTRAVAPGGCAPVIDWILERKRRWLATTGRGSLWLGTQEYQRQLIAAAALGCGLVGVMVSILTLDGRILAAKVSRLDHACVEFVVSTFDVAYGRFSPAMLLYEDLLKWACEQRLEADFRMGGETYKETWTNTHGNCLTLRGAVNWWGSLFAAAARARARIQARP